MFYVDAHCDSVMGWVGVPGEPNPPRHLDFERMRITPGGLQWMACFVPVELPAHTTVQRMLDELDARQAASGLPTIGTASELRALRESGSWGVLRAIEGGDALSGDDLQNDNIPDGLTRLGALYERGVRALGFTWNHANALCGGAATPELGLTAFGYRVLMELEALGMVADLSHISTTGFWDVLRHATKPPAVTHTACHALREHRRNLTDLQIQSVANRGGVMGVCLYPDFLVAEGERCTLDTLVGHLLHLHKVGGREAVAIGTDFDGIETPPEGIRDVTDMPKLWEALRAAGLPESDLDLLMGGNWCRLLEDCL